MFVSFVCSQACRGLCYRWIFPIDTEWQENVLRMQGNVISPQSLSIRYFPEQLHAKPAEVQGAAQPAVGSGMSKSVAKAERLKKTISLKNRRYDHRAGIPCVQHGKRSGFSRTMRLSGLVRRFTA